MSLKLQNSAWKLNVLPCVSHNAELAYLEKAIFVLLFTLAVDHSGLDLYSRMVLRDNESNAIFEFMPVMCFMYGSTVGDGMRSGTTYAGHPISHI